MTYRDYLVLVLGNLESNPDRADVVASGFENAGPSNRTYRISSTEDLALALATARGRIE